LSQQNQNQPQISNNPWESPNMQMLLSIFNGKVIALKPINVVDVVTSNTNIR